MKKITGKRKIASAFLAALILSLASCNVDNSAPTDQSSSAISDVPSATVSEATVAAEPDIEGIAKSLYDTVEFDEVPESIDSNAVKYNYGTDDSVNGVAYLSTGTTEQIAVFDAGTDENAEKLESDLKKYMENQISIWVTYNPGEAKRMENAVITRHGNIVILCVAGDKNDVKDAVSAAIGA